VTINFDTYAVACPSGSGATGRAFIGAAASTAFAHAQGSAMDARMDMTAKPVMLPARPWESTPPREPSRL
jgi:hypothetical protein